MVNGASRPTTLYFQVDLTLGPVPDDAGLLHVAFRRENPTTIGRDFVILEPVRGPGRYLGCVVGVRVLDPGTWYGEGEVKVYRDGDTDHPTICGTGLEDYVGTAWGMGAHAAPYGGAPLDVRPAGSGGLVGLARVRRLLPVARARTRSCSAARPGDHPADRDAPLPGRRGGGTATRTLATNPLAGAGWFDPVPGAAAARGCSSGSTTTRPPRSSTCASRSRAPRRRGDPRPADLIRRAHEPVDPLEGFLG